MIALSAALLLQATQPNPFQNLIPPAPPPGFRPAPQRPPWEDYPVAPPGWRFVGGSTTGAAWFVHPGTATRTQYQSSIWVKIDYSRDRTVSERRAQGMVIFYCAQRRYHWESLGRYDASERLIDGLGVTRDENIAPDSMIEAVWRVACEVGER